MPLHTLVSTCVRDTRSFCEPSSTSSSSTRPTGSSPGCREVVDDGCDRVRTVDVTQVVDHLARVGDLGDTGGDPDDADGVVHGCHDAEHLRAVDAVDRVVDAMELLDATSDDVFLVQLRPALQVDD